MDSCFREIFSKLILLYMVSFDISLFGKNSFSQSEIESNGGVSMKKK